jgi:hypothetical protein
MELRCKDLLENKVGLKSDLIINKFQLFQSVKLDDIRDYDKKASLLKMAVSFNTPSVTVPVDFFCYVIRLNEFLII